MRYFAISLFGALTLASFADIGVAADEPTASAAQAIAAEKAMVAMAQSQGMWASYRAFAAPEARMFGSDGIVDAIPYLKDKSDTEKPTQWAPFEFLISCDSSLAISQGRFEAANGNKGVYNTVWKRQPDGAYLWVFDFGFNLEDVPASVDPVPVRAASCGEPPAMEVGNNSVQRSSDGSLAWSIERTPEGLGDYRIWLSEDDQMNLIVHATINPGS